MYRGIVGTLWTHIGHDVKARGYPTCVLTPVTCRNAHTSKRLVRTTSPRTTQPRSAPGHRRVCMPVQLYTVEEAAQRLNTTTRFIRRLVAERRIAFTKV